MALNMQSDKYDSKHLFLKIGWHFTWFKKHHKKAIQVCFVVLGRHCEKRMYDCAVNSCQNGGSCVPTGETNYTCRCTRLYTGQYCQFQTGKTCQHTGDPIRSWSGIFCTQQTAQYFWCSAHWSTRPPHHIASTVPYRIKLLNITIVTASCIWHCTVIYAFFVPFIFILLSVHALRMPIKLPCSIIQYIAIRSLEALRLLHPYSCTTTWFFMVFSVEPKLATYTAF